MWTVCNIRSVKVDGYNVVRVDRVTVLGNPFTIGRDGSRDQVIQKYRQWLWVKIKEKGEVYTALLKLYNDTKGRDVKLACHCAPKACHADLLVRALVWIQKQERSAA
jgi:hypothetical protein